jgi:hypothetical protein
VVKQDSCCVVEAKAVADALIVGRPYKSALVCSFILVSECSYTYSLKISSNRIGAVYDDDEELSRNSIRKTSVWPVPI